MVDRDLLSAKLADLVRQIETHETRVYAEKKGESVELVGTLAHTRLGSHERFDVKGSGHGFGPASAHSAKGRMFRDSVVIAVIADSGATAECELNDYGVQELSEIPVGRRVTVDGTLRGWSATEKGIVPFVEDCWVRPYGE